MNSIRIKSIVLLLVFLLITFFVFGQKDEVEQYKMTIKAMAIPLFAVDRLGNPVQDLKKDELEILINGKKIDFFLNHRKFQTKRSDAETEVQQDAMPRLIFICFDTIFNNKGGLRRSKSIAKKLIEQSNQVDKFIILKFSVKEGVSLLLRPTSNRPELFSAIEKVSINEAMNPNAVFRPVWRWTEGYGLFDARDLRAGHYTLYSFGPTQITNVPGKFRNATVNSYNSIIKIFTNIFEKMEFLLKTVNKPKMVFLLSHGMRLKGEVITRNRKPKQKAKVKDVKNAKNVKENTDEKPVVEEKTTRVYSQLFLKYMKRIALAVNNGGSQLFTINSTGSGAGATALKCMADESGGKYYSNRDVKQLVNNIHKDLSAYYEVYFQLDENIKNPIKLKYRCKRKGVKIKSIKTLKQISDFADLNELQKQVFIVDAFLSNNWKKYFKKHSAVDFTISEEKTISKCVVKLDKSEFNGEKAEIFLISRNKNTDHFEFKIYKKDVKDREIIEFKKESDKTYFFVIVNLKKSNCVYNII